MIIINPCSRGERESERERSLDGDCATSAYKNAVHTGSRARRTVGTCLSDFDIVIVDGLRSVSRVNEPRARTPNNSCAASLLRERRRIIASYGNVYSRARII